MFIPLASLDLDRPVENRAATMFPGECVELPLLLPAHQAARLEELARQQGLTAGQLLRRLVSEFTARSVAGQ